MENLYFFGLAQSAVLASTMEVTTHPKPGNVTRLQPGRDATVSHFLVSSCALFPTYLEAAMRGKRYVEGEGSLSNLGIGLLIRQGIEHTHNWGITTNTNLGIVLLTVPLVAAAAILETQHPTLHYDPQKMSDLLSKIIKSSSSDDAINTIKAIQLANPGGLGKASKFDVNQPSVEREIREAGTNLYGLFSSCTHIDLICKEYTTGFQIVLFETVPKLEKFLEHACFENAISLLFLYLLKQKIDSLITRKFGRLMAEEIRNKANEYFPSELTIELLNNPKILQFDAELRKKGINPGTLADLVAATLFCYFYKNFSEKGIKIPLCEPSSFKK